MILFWMHLTNFFFVATSYHIDENPILNGLTIPKPSNFTKYIYIMIENRQYNNIIIII